MAPSPTSKHGGVSLVDISSFLPAETIGHAMARMYEIDGERLAPVLGPMGVSAICPISLLPVKSPALLADGCIYEEEAAMSWLRESDRSPCTRLRLSHRRVLRLSPLKEICEHILSRNSADTQLDRAVEQASIAEAPLCARVAFLDACVSDAADFIAVLQKRVDEAKIKGSLLKAELETRRLHSVVRLQAAIRGRLARREFPIVRRRSPERRVAVQSALVEGAVETVLDELGTDNADSVAERLTQGYIDQQWDSNCLMKTLLIRILCDARRCTEFVELLCAIHGKFPNSTQTQSTISDTDSCSSHCDMQQNFMRFFLRYCQKEFALAFQPESSRVVAQHSLLAGKGCCLAFSTLLGHLFVRKLLSVKTLEQLLRCLLCLERAPPHVEDNTVECACVLLQAAGQSLTDSAQGKLLMAECLALLDDLKHAVGLDGRHLLHKGIRHQIQVLLDPRTRRTSLVSSPGNSPTKAAAPERSGYV